MECTKYMRSKAVRCLKRKELFWRGTFMILLANQRHLILWSWMNTKNLHGVCACKSYLLFEKLVHYKKVSPLIQVLSPRVQMPSSLKNVSKKQQLCKLVPCRPSSGPRESQMDQSYCVHLSPSDLQQTQLSKFSMCLDSYIPRGLPRLLKMFQ